MDRETGLQPKSGFCHHVNVVIHSHGFSYHSYADDTHLILSFPQSETQVVAQISACLTDISQWMSAHHLKINLDKNELLLLPGKNSPTHDLTINFDNSVLTPTQTARNLGVTLDSQLSLTAHITATTRSCRSRTWSNVTPQPIQSALLLPMGLLLPHCELNTHQNLDCLLFWLLNGGMSSPWTSGQQKVYTSSAAN